MGLSLPQLSSVANPRIRHAVRLRESSRYRRQHAETIIDGVREIARAAASGMEPRTVYVAQSRVDDPAILELLEDVTWRRAAFEVNDRAFEKIAFGDRNEGIVAAVAVPEISLSALKPRPHGVVVVLDRLEKPGNLGAILRTADATGVAAVVLSDPLVDLLNPAAIRASLGTIFGLPIAAGTAAEVIEWLLARGQPIYAARVDGSKAPWEVPLKNSAIVLGNEAEGLGAHWVRAEVIPIRLPMQGIADSLNVSATAAAILYEAVRQATANTVGKK